MNDWPVIHAYTRRQALRDGALVSLDAGETAGLPGEAGVLLPIAMTSGAYATYVALTPAARAAGNDVRGRAWDVLWMFARAARRAREESSIEFEFYASVERRDPQLSRLKAVIGPDDDGEPCITLMDAWED